MQSSEFFALASFVILSVLDVAVAVPAVVVPRALCFNCGTDAYAANWIGNAVESCKCKYAGMVFVTDSDGFTCGYCTCPKNTFKYSKPPPYDATPFCRKCSDVTGAVPDKMDGSHCQCNVQEGYVWNDATGSCECGPGMVRGSSGVACKCQVAGQEIKVKDGLAYCECKGTAELSGPGWVSDGKGGCRCGVDGWYAGKGFCDRNTPSGDDCVPKDVCRPCPAIDKSSPKVKATDYQVGITCPCDKNLGRIWIKEDSQSIWALPGTDVVSYCKCDEGNERHRTGLVHDGYQESGGACACKNPTQTWNPAWYRCGCKVGEFVRMSDLKGVNPADFRGVNCRACPPNSTSEALPSFNTVCRCQGKDTQWTGEVTNTCICSSNNFLMDSKGDCNPCPQNQTLNKDKNSCECPGTESVLDVASGWCCPKGQHYDASKRYCVRDS